MRLVYQTPSLNNANHVETQLIDHAHRYYPGKYLNTNRGMFAEFRDAEVTPHFFVYYLEDRG